jgi:Zn-dependent protease with chaperone function
MVVYTALLKNVQTEAGLAFVLAHELGHIERHHVQKSIFVSAVSSIFGNLFFKADTTSSKIYNGVSYFHNLSYSRGKEKDADLFAVTLVDKFYCKDPNKLEFFKRNSANQTSGKLAEYFSTHPLTSTRLAYLDEAFTVEKCVF